MPKFDKKKLLFILALFLFQKVINASDELNPKIDSLKNVIESREGQNKISAYINLSEILYHSSLLKSIEIAKEGIEYCRQVPDVLGEIKLLNQVGLNYRILGNYQLSLENYIESLKLAEELDNENLIGEINSNIGNVYNYLGDMPKALDYYETSLVIRQRLQDSLAIAKSLNNIGNVYKVIDQNETALNYFNESLRLKLAHSDSLLAISTFKNIGSTLINLNRLNEAEKYYNTSYQLELRISDSLGIANSLIMLADLYINKEEYYKALEAVQNAKRISEKLNAAFFILRSHYLIAEINEKLGLYKNALNAFKNYQTMSDSLNNVEVRKHAIELDAVFDRYQKDKAVKELEITRQTLFRNVYFIIAILVIITATIIYIRYREKAKISKEIIEKNKELESAIEKAEKANELKSDFLAQMSHEIRTLINTILNYTSLLRIEFEDKCSPELKGSFNSIENGAKRLLRTIDLILNMSDIESGTFEVIKRDHSLNKDIIQPVLDEFRSYANSRNLELKFDHNLENDIVNVDAYTITQTLVNLVDNSVKYTMEGSITIKTELINGYKSISVSDTGIGIAPEYLPELFSKFSQEEHGYTRRYEGTGLGLALVKQYCEMNGAEINVESEKGVGTTFTIIFDGKK